MGKTRRIALAAALVIMLPILTAACDTDGDGGGTSPRKDAGQAPPPAVVPPEANQPGPQADPGQCTDRGAREASLHATWSSETKATPQIFYTKNGVKTPATNLESHRNRAGMVPWGGEWSMLVSVVCHDVLMLDLIGTPSQSGCLISIVDLGDGPVGSGRRDHTCHVEYTVP